MIPAPTTKKRTMWCGPYALAVVLGVSYDEAYELVRKVTGRPRIKGVYRGELCRALGRHKMRVRFEKLMEHAKLRAWWRDDRSTRMGTRTLRSCLDYLKPNRLYIVNVSGHYVVLDTSDMTVIDNQEKGWFPVDRHKAAGRRVKFVAEIRKV